MPFLLRAFREAITQKRICLIAFLITFLLLAGCHGRRSDSLPVVEFTRVPPVGKGGPDTLELIQGRVTGALPGQRIVLYARTEGWWVQPLDTAPFAKIESDSTWKQATHLGTDYAALLVNPEFVPPPTTNELPARGSGVIAVAYANGRKGNFSTAQSLNFSGYEWKTSALTRFRYGGINYYDPSNVWTDSKGFLHLRIVRQQDGSSCSGVSLTRSLGYGTYMFTVQDIARFEPAVALSFLTWDDLDMQQRHRELDIEMSRWGIPDNKNADYVVQPSWFPENKVKFVAPAGPLIQMLHWEPGKASFQTFRRGPGASSNQIVSSKVFSSGIPTPGNELVNIDFCDFKHGRVPLQNGAEVVIEKFQYLP